MMREAVTVVTRPSAVRVVCVACLTAPAASSERWAVVRKMGMARRETLGSGLLMWVMSVETISA